MSRVLFVVLAEKGHVHPFIGPAQELARRGHTVGFYSPCDLREPLGRAGFSQVFVGSRAAPPPDANRGQAFAELVADRDRLRAWIRAMRRRCGAVRGTSMTPYFAGITSAE